jgi:arylsulfatase A-like enzyme
MNCNPLPDPIDDDWTRSFDDIKCYDQLKVNAVLQWIDGNTHLGHSHLGVPAIFGMNFQAVSVGQKLIENKVKGGYLDAAGNPSENLKKEIVFVDAALGQMVAELMAQGLYDSTAIIVTAKHGQSPVDPSLFFPIPGHAPLNNGQPPSALLGPAFLPDSEINQIGPTEDDISLLWLTGTDQTQAAVDILQTHAQEAGISQIFSGHSLEQMFDRPGLPPAGDPRTPDIIVQPKVGVVYTGSLAKQAEHGGFAPNDVEVMVLVSNPRITAKTLGTPVETKQVAPTILSLLGLDPNLLDAVRLEGTRELPGIQFK